jgi:hypothetical protein
MRCNQPDGHTGDHLLTADAPGIMASVVVSVHAVDRVRDAAQAVVLTSDGLRGWWRDGEDVATVPLVAFGAVQFAIERLRAVLEESSG